MKKIQTLTIVLTLTLLIASINFLTTNASEPEEPQNADAMWIEPSSIELNTDTYSVGYKFNVTVWINLTVTCGTWEFKLVYNKAYLNATRCAYTAGTKSEFFQGLATLPMNPSFGPVNSTHNYVLHAEAILMPPYRAPGYGSLAWVEFEVMMAPPEGETITTMLDISTFYPGDTFAQDEEGTKIPMTVYDATYSFRSTAAPTPPVAVFTWTPSIPVAGEVVTFDASGSYDPDGTIVSYFWDFGDETNSSGVIVTHAYATADSYLITLTVTDDNELTDTESKTITVKTPTPPPTGAILAVDPPKIIDLTMLPGSTFSINITVGNVTKLKTCEFNLTYNTDILSWIGFFIYEIEGQRPTAQAKLDDEAGFIWVKLAYATPFSTLDPIAMVKIEFVVDNLGASVLDLHDTQLLDENDEQIEHVVIDGFFLTQIRDVAVTDVQTNVTSIYQGWPVNISVTVKNKGNASETFTVIAYYCDTEIGNITVTDLPPGNETTVYIIWDTTNTSECQNYTISAEALPVPYETNLADNSYTDGTITIRLLGDLTGDGIVSIDDVFLASQAFGSYPGQSRWDPYADVDHNNRIDIADIFLIAQRFGTRCQ